MNETTDPKKSRYGRPNLIAVGFIGAFALSVITVIYTGLNVRDHGAAFDAGFRSITLAVGERRTIDLVFESTVGFPEAVLEVTLPGMLRFSGASSGQSPRSTVAVEPGSNTFSIEIEATETGKDYLRTRIVDDIEAIDLYRVFVTVEEN